MTFLNDRLPLRWQEIVNDKRLMLGISMTDTRKLKRLAGQIEEDVEYWHRIAFPLGEEIRLEPDVVRVLKPHIKRLGFGTMREFEKHLEQESGNPPSLLQDVYSALQGRLA